VFVLVIGLAPRSAVATPTAIFVVAPGQVAHIHAPPLRTWSIPSDRESFDEYERAFLEEDDGALTEILSRPGRILVLDGQPARVILMDGAATLVELLDGPGAGQQGWLKTRQLRP